MTEQQAMYDDVPRRYSVHEYMNSSVALGGEEQVVGSEQDSFPDLLQMVTKSKTPSPVVKARTPSDNTDVAQLYAKVTFFLISGVLWIENQIGFFSITTKTFTSKTNYILLFCALKKSYKHLTISVPTIFLYKKPLISFPSPPY